MTTQLRVANLALGHLAIGRPLASINESTQPARVMKQFYDQARDETLREFNWPFARKFATLALVATAPVPDWGFSYRYPDDCLFVRDVYTVTRRPLESTARTPYSVGQDDSGRLVYASTASLKIEYTVAIDEEYWPPDFAAAVSFLLAWYASPSITGGDPQKLGDRARSAYQEAIARAQLAGENEQDEDLQVANLALLHLNAGRPDDSPGEQLRVQRAVRQLYAQVRDEMFREFNWPFARKFASLTKVAGPSPRASTDFLYSYRYPVDCAAAHILRNGPRRALASGAPPGAFNAFDASQTAAAAESRVPFIVGQDVTGRLILTDAEPVAASGDWAAFPELEYTVVIDQALWPADFLAAVAARLAWQAAPFVVKGDASRLRERVRGEYDLAIGRAWGAHLNEREPDPDPDSSFISARN